MGFFGGLCNCHKIDANESTIHDLHDKSKLYCYTFGMELGRQIEAGKATEAARMELEGLRRRAAQLEAVIKTEASPAGIESRQEAAKQAVGEQWQKAVQKPSPADVPRALSHPDAITLQLSAEEHDERMGEFVHTLQEKGVSKAIAAAEATGNPHLIDDFHRVLVEWVREGLPAKGSDKKPYKVPLSMALYEVTLPQDGGAEKPTDPTKALREFISLMEQFYRGMLQLDTKSGEYFSFEIANPVGTEYTSIYIAVPKIRKTMFEKQLLSLYPSARVVERHDDYNAFVDGAQTAAASASQAERHIYSLRTVDSFSNDPLDSLLNAFSKLDEKGEGASVQFVISPRDKGLLKQYRRAHEQVLSGTPLRYATKVRTGVTRVLHDLFIDTFFAPEKKAPEDRLKPDDLRLKNIENKIASPVLLADIRIVASAATAERARAILQDIESPFQQFSDTAGNRLLFKEVLKRKLKSFAHSFSYRMLDESAAMPLSAMELTILAHLPRPEAMRAAPQLRQDKSQAAAAPVGLLKEGTLLGINRFRGGETKVYIQPEDRLRHLYLIGQTGTGKSVLLKNIVKQDIQSGAGVCFIDPHGTDVMDILSSIPPERIDDVIYFDPGSMDRPMGLNMLEYDPAHPEQKTLVVDELFGIFKKLFGQIPESMGPAFEQYFRNSALLVMEDPASGNTLLDISRIFADPDFRARKLSACKNPIIKQFWEGIAAKTTGEQGLENFAPYVTSKFDVFTTNDFVRPMIAQQKSAFNFRDLMDNRKILLVNLAKGLIGDLNANLLGLVIVGKFLIAALSRADSFGKELPPFYLHIDEFQNFITPSIATIFSEARKYKLSLTVAHQFIAQLTDEIKDSVFGNVGSICAFRVGADDGEYLEKQFAPTFTAADMVRIDNYNAHLKLLIGGKPATPFDIHTLPFESGSPEHVAQMQELSALRYGRPRAEVEAEITAMFGTPPPQDPATLAQSGV